MNSKHYAVVYVGCEGIDHILWATQTPSEAVEKVQEFRAIAEHNSKLDDEERYKLPYPELCGAERDRVCVMNSPTGERVYSCCCRELGVQIERPIYY